MEVLKGPVAARTRRSNLPGILAFCNKSNTSDDKTTSVEFCYTGKRLSKDSFKVSDCSVYFVQKGWYLYVRR